MPSSRMKQIHSRFSNMENFFLLQFPHELELSIENNVPFVYLQDKFTQVITVTTCMAIRPLVQITTKTKPDTVYIVQGHSNTTCTCVRNKAWIRAIHGLRCTLKTWTDNPWIMLCLPNSGIVLSVHRQLFRSHEFLHMNYFFIMTKNQASQSAEHPLTTLFSRTSQKTQRMGEVQYYRNHALVRPIRVLHKSELCTFCTVQFMD